MQLLNEAVWQSVKGAGSTMPASQHNVIDPPLTPTRAEENSLIPNGQW